MHEIEDNFCVEKEGKVKDVKFDQTTAFDAYTRRVK